MIVSCLFFTAAMIWPGGALPIVAQAVSADGGPPASVSGGGHRSGEPAPLIFWNREITVFRANYNHLSPAQRATNAAARIAALPEVEKWEFEAKETTNGKYSGVVVTVNGQLAFGLLPEDVDPESGETLKEAADLGITRLRAALEARARQRNWPLMLRATGVSLSATLLFLSGLWLVVRGRRSILPYMEKAAERRARLLTIGGVSLHTHVITAGRRATKLVVWALGVILTYLWLTYVLMRFPYTHPWGEKLGAFLTELFKELGHGVVNAVPKIFTLFIIFLLTWVVVRLVNDFFREVEEGDIPVPWLDRETAWATRRLVVVLIWIFALTVAYPYIPGSHTDAFKGVSVFVGLMVSLGSAGMVNQVMSGLVVIYSRALKPGEFVRIGDDEGMVSDVGLLSTKIKTRKREEITIPNAVLVGTTTVNYSRLLDKDGAVVSTSITIGYDAAWRQVHALLLLAADRTAGVRKDPRPRVLQKALSDFFVEYQLVVNLDRPEERALVLSELHAQIQDAFNEFGVQIMSPHFETQPADKVFVPKSHWFSSPAKAASNGASD